MVYIINIVESMNNKFFNMFTMPNLGCDLSFYKKAMSKNSEAISSANQTAIEGVQAISRKMMEAMQRNYHDMISCWRDGCGHAEEMPKQQGEKVNKLMQESCNDMREIAEIASKCTMEYIDICNKRASEAVQEMWHQPFVKPAE
jgi:phasin family protein